MRGALVSGPSRAPVSRPSRALFALAGLSLAVLGVEAACVAAVRRRPLPEPTRFPGCSVLVPLSGDDPELPGNLAALASIDYPGEWEVLLGIDSDGSAAGSGRALAAAHPGRVRVVEHAERGGTNPRVNQLVVLTRAARHEVLACLDANVRVPRGWLREIVAALERPGVGLATHLIAGTGERRFGAAVDNQAMLAFVAPNVATASVLLGQDQIVGKSVAVPRGVLEGMGGWETVRDTWGEDKKLGPALGALGLRAHLCPTPVRNVQAEQGLGAFWARQTRWAAIRFRLLRPGFFLEPLLNTTLLAGLALALSPRSRPAAALAAGAWGAGAGFAELFARLVRGHGFAARHLALFPAGQLLLFAAWARGATIRRVGWHGRTFRLDADARLVPEAAEDS